MPRGLVMPVVGAIDDGVLQVQDDPVPQYATRYVQYAGVAGHLDECPIVKQGRPADIQVVYGGKRIAPKFRFLLRIDGIDPVTPVRNLVRRQQGWQDRIPLHRNFFGASVNVARNIGPFSDAVGFVHLHIFDTFRR